ncbi:carboxylate-amine ligase [Brasilonema octagenarum UFV-E1]|uniref:Carboxylate-amine ligase n=1 Tax=Brasilonema sennae CENA114 TaxID=415709 RepID=A0A856MHF5_9CYAN|nr:peptide ligase PGM1-related protein [Brasilonema sennae]QDL08537.1 carboxylate-amine ligase [Brasilonema sennae CENA114]QDL14892.1 carboxylate-amine ligase [Brasilonema octagenarum UFV-E1]
MQKLNIFSNEQTDKFRNLQLTLSDRWNTFQEIENSDADILVIPSLSIDQGELKKIEGFEHYEERLLFYLIQLQNPCTRLIYITSMPMHPSVIDYYLQLLPGIPFSHARNRLLLLSTYDSSAKPLTQKILERPRLLKQIHQALRVEKSFMVCYNSTELEAELSLKLKVPLFAAAPDSQIWGTKSGSRQIFAESGVPFPDGCQSVWNDADLAQAAAELWERQPTLKRIVVKLNEGISGEGNALLDLRPILNLAPPGSSHEERLTAMSECFKTLRFQAKEENWETFSLKIPELGAIVEAFVEGEVKRSPSVQGLITPNGEVEILSTHDQILGGPDGQVYLGCEFPADETYRLQLQQIGLKVGKNLADKGALERFAVDFIAVDNGDGQWDLQAIEINLRKGGTTHPFMSLKLLTNGRYELSTGLFYTQQGRPKYYMATDNLQKDSYRGLLPNDLMDIIARHRLHFDTGTETGTVFHLMGCLSQFGKLGLTSIGNSPQQAEETYNKVIKVLDKETSSNNNDLSSSSEYAFPMTWDGSSC